jgi:group I intron endonuclease
LEQYYGYIYLTTNLINNKKYIGMHTKFDKNYFGSGLLITRAIEKYGIENFKKEILEYANNKEELGELEKKYIEKYNAAKSKEFYNIHSGGFGGNTIAGYTEEQMKKHIEILLKNVVRGEKHPFFGKKRCIKDVENIKIGCKKRWKNISDKDMNNFKEIMSKVTTGEKNPNYNHKWNDEQKRKLSELRIKNGKSIGTLNGMYGKKGENAITGKNVYMYDINFNLIKKFNTIGLALQFLNLKGACQLRKSIKNKTIYYGYYWSFDEKFNDYPNWE